MFLRPAAHVFSFAAHAVAVSSALVAGLRTPLPAIDPPYATLTWIHFGPPAPPTPPPPSKTPRLESTVTIGLTSNIDALISEDEDEVSQSPPSVLGGVCGCVMGGAIVGDASYGLVSLAAPTVPEESPLAATPLRAGFDTAIPAKVVDAAPTYPPLARNARIEGVVILDATIDEYGDVVDVRVLRSISALDRAAIEAVRRWRYAPATVNGLPVRALLTVTVAFTLPQ